jgi:DNA (cytosine-5)-methyltransferase 1
VKVVSLFSGAGGADLGMLQAGLDVVFAAEINETYADTYNKNLPPVCRCMDVAHIEHIGLPEHDVIIGGPPCQSFSTNKKTDKFNCSGLENIINMQKIVTKYQPKLFVFENVSSLLDYNLKTMGAIMQIKNGFPDYFLRVHRVNTSDYGIPQDRERMFIFGTHDTLLKSIPNFMKPPTNPVKAGWHRYLKKSRFCTYIRNASCVDGRMPDEMAYTVTGAERPCYRFSNGRVTKEYRISKSLHGAFGIEQVYVDIGDLMSLQGFPCDYKFSGSVEHMRMQIGNAWSVNVAKAIGDEIVKCLKRS